MAVTGCRWGVSVAANQRPDVRRLTNQRSHGGLAPGSVMLDTNIYTTTVNHTLTGAGAAHTWPDLRGNARDSKPWSVLFLRHQGVLTAITRAWNGLYWHLTVPVPFLVNSKKGKGNLASGLSLKSQRPGEGQVTVVRWRWKLKSFFSLPLVTDFQVTVW